MARRFNAPGGASGAENQMSSRDRQIEELARALRETAEQLAGTAREVAELRAVLDAVTEILVAGELLSPGHRRLLDKLRARAGGSGQPVRLRPMVDKHRVPNADIDCASRLHLCHARCCSFSVVLTEQDLESGQIRWELDQPYLLRHEVDGYCAHLDRAAGGGCTLYRERPAACREFDCREDRRVWIDFEAGEPAPMPPGLLPLEERRRKR